MPVRLWDASDLFQKHGGNLDSGEGGGGADVGVPESAAGRAGREPGEAEVRWLVAADGVYGRLTAGLREAVDAALARVEASGRKLTIKNVADVFAQWDARTPAERAILSGNPAGIHWTL
ncbi:MAG: hypothetical protein ACOX5G_07860 [Kiritimatiellia bacterium]